MIAEWESYIRHRLSAISHPAASNWIPNSH
jgi:hypothetical protein